MSDETEAARAFARQRAAMAVTNTTGPEKSVLLVLAIMANADGEAWPPISGVNGLAAKCSLGRRTVQEAVVSLLGKKLIERTERPGKGAIYRLCLEVRASRTCAAPAHVRQPPGRCAPPAPKQPRTTIPQKASPSSEARGQRLSPDFEMPDDWLAWAMKERGWDRETAQRVADGFKDFWIGKAGAQARKTDWAATWRNWVRNQRGNQHGTTDRGYQPSAALAFKRYGQALAEAGEPQDDRDDWGPWPALPAEHETG